MATCTRCGSENLTNAVYCGVCGADMPYEPKNRPEPLPRPPDATLPGPPLDTTSHPRKTAFQPLTPGERLQVTRAAPAPASTIWTSDDSSARRYGTTLWIAGNCAIVAGVLAVIQGLVMIAGGAVAIGVSVSFLGLEILFGFVSIALGVLSILGGIDARLRVRYGRTLVRAILGMVAVGFGIGALLGLVAVILIAICREGFKSDSAGTFD